MAESTYSVGVLGTSIRTKQLCMVANKPSEMVLMNEMIYEINHTLNYGYEIKLSYDPRSYVRNFSNCVEKLEKLRARLFKSRLRLIQD